MVDKQQPSSPADSVRFAFGGNWTRLLPALDEQRIQQAEQSLLEALGLKSLVGKSFLDIGSGSGLFSLAAWRLGAQVYSIDIDPQCVACAGELRCRFAADESRWWIGAGSILDDHLQLPQEYFDIVYSWGVLHHTGCLWDALAKTITLVGDHGQLFIAIYNDQGAASIRWQQIKRWYNRCPAHLRFAILIPAALRLWGPTMLRDLLRGRPFYTWRNYGTIRGMSPWRDVVDWVGGYPFEVATPDQVFQFCYQRGLQLTYLKTCGGGLGCNEFVFRKQPTATLSRESHAQAAAADVG